MIRFIRNIARAFTILLRLALYGAPIYILQYHLSDSLSPSKKHIALKKIGSSITRFLQNSGPSFIKLGQILSTRPDLTGEIISKELLSLQDKLGAFDLHYVKQEIQRHFGQTVEQIFKSFEETPKAAASIAQVHKAVRQNNQVVAVKILRPNIEKLFERDLEFFRFCISFLNTFKGSALSRLRLTEVVSMLSDIVKLELDLRFEAASADQIRQNCKNDKGFIVPEIHWDLISNRVMVSSWIEGVPVNDVDSMIKSGINPKVVAKNLAITFFNQAYRDGFFHADLHQGNIFATQNGNIAMVDFGIVGSLSKADRMYIAEILYGFITRDYDRVAEVHFRAGYVPMSQNRTNFMLACRAIGEPIIGKPVNQISIAQLLKQLFEITKQFNMETQPQLLLLQKTMVTLEGVGYSIYPDVNMWQLAEPWIKQWANENFGLKARAHEFYESSRALIATIPSVLQNLDKAASNISDYKLKRKAVRSKANALIIGLILGATIATAFFLST